MIRDNPSRVDWQTHGIEYRSVSKKRARQSLPKNLRSKEWTVEEAKKTTYAEATKNPQKLQAPLCIFFVQNTYAFRY